MTPEQYAAWQWWESREGRYFEKALAVVVWVEDGAPPTTIGRHRDGRYWAWLCPSGKLLALSHCNNRDSFGGFAFYVEYLEPVSAPRPAIRSRMFRDRKAALVYLRAALIGESVDT